MRRAEDDGGGDVGRLTSKQTAPCGRLIFVDRRRMMRHQQRRLLSLPLDSSTVDESALLRQQLMMLDHIALIDDDDGGGVDDGDQRHCNLHLLIGGVGDGPVGVHLMLIYVLKSHLMMLKIAKMLAVAIVVVAVAAVDFSCYHQ